MPGKQQYTRRNKVGGGLIGAEFNMWPNEVILLSFTNRATTDVKQDSVVAPLDLGLISLYNTPGSSPQIKPRGNQPNGTGAC